MLRWLPSLGGFGVAISLCVGVIGGAGGYTFYYAEGASYLSNDPAACINCHVMRPYFDDWQRAGHHHVAVCNDCHIPHDNLVGKYAAKADAGFRHSWGFTFENFHEPITMIPRSERIVEQNCVRCHESMVHPAMAVTDAVYAATNCLHCHRSVGHGPIK